MTEIHTHSKHTVADNSATTAAHTCPSRYAIAKKIHTTLPPAEPEDPRRARQPPAGLDRHLIPRRAGRVPQLPS